jgi:hypothetical protein
MRQSRNWKLEIEKIRTNAEGVESAEFPEKKAATPKR